MAGRPTKLTKELQEEICGYIENGASFKDACLLCNIHIDSFCTWRSQGNGDIEAGKETIHSEFSEAVKKAEAKFKVFHIQQITSASTKNKQWQASAWLLERKYPGEYGKKDKLDLEGNINSKVEKTNIIKVENTDEELDDLIEIFKSIKGIEKTEFIKSLQAEAE